MQKHIFTSACIATTLLAAVVTALAQTPATAPTTAPTSTAPATLSPTIKTAQDQLNKWVNDFYGKTEDELVKELGLPSTRDTDKDGDTVLTFKTADHAKITFYFSKRNRVILASYSIMTD